MTTEQFGVEGEATIVTGSSRGIGRAIAEKFGADGADVVLCAPEDERGRLDAVADGIDAGPGDGRAVAVACDVTDRDDVEALVEATVGTFGGVDVLVNNVGGDRTAPFDRLSSEQWDEVLELNLDGTFNCTGVAGDHLKDGGGAVINIASGAGLQGFPNASAYGVAKAGIVNLTETLAHEWAHDDVRVNCIAPGLIATERVLESPEMKDVPDPAGIDRGTVARRVGTPEEVADMAQVLASPAASFVTGRTLFVGGVPRLERQFEVTRFGEGENAWIW